MPTDTSPITVFDCRRGPNMLGFCIGDVVMDRATNLPLYNAGLATNDPIQSTLQFSGNVIEWANHSEDEGLTGSSFTYTVDGTNLDLTNVCPNPGPGDPAGYTATETTLTLFLDAVYTFTKD